MRVENISPSQIKVDRFTIEGFSIIDVPDDLYLLFQDVFLSYVNMGLLSLPLNKEVTGVEGTKIQDYSEAVNSLGLVTSPVTIDLSKGNLITATVNGVCSWILSGGIPGSTKSFTLVLTNGGIGAQTFSALSFVTSIKWPGGTAPSLTASGTDVLCFFYDPTLGGWRGVLAQTDSK